MILKLTFETKISHNTKCACFEKTLLILDTITFLGYIRTFQTSDTYFKSSFLQNFGQFHRLN